MTSPRSHHSRPSPASRRGNKLIVLGLLLVIVAGPLTFNPWFGNSYFGILNSKGSSGYGILLGDKGIILHGATKISLNLKGRPSSFWPVLGVFTNSGIVLFYQDGDFATLGAMLLKNGQKVDGESLTVETLQESKSILQNDTTVSQDIKEEIMSYINRVSK